LDADVDVDADVDADAGAGAGAGVGGHADVVGAELGEVEVEERDEVEDAYE
jgi:hypothetical protein